MRTSTLAFATTAAITMAALAACASNPGTQPNDMSAAQHEAMANQQAAEAREHDAKYDPNASTEAPHRCHEGSVATEASPCWSSSSNPTAHNLNEAKVHRRIAAEHRAASDVLRDAEARACAGVSDDDRDMSPFHHREDILRVDPLTESAGPKGTPRVAGAVVFFRAVPGMTEAWLQRVVDCHIARNAALGHRVPEMAYCPLVPGHVTARVTTTSGALSVAIRSDDAASAAEVLKRAQSLTSQ